MDEDYAKIIRGEVRAAAKRWRREVRRSYALGQRLVITVDEIGAYQAYVRAQRAQSAEFARRGYPF